MCDIEIEKKVQEVAQGYTESMKLKIPGLHWRTMFFVLNRIQNYFW